MEAGPWARPRPVVGMVVVALPALPGWCTVCLRARDGFAGAVGVLRALYRCQPRLAASPMDTHGVAMEPFELASIFCLTHCRH